MASGSPATMNKIEKAHQLYREGKYAEALDYYTEALSVAKTKPQKIALHSNRAACYLKLHRFHQAAEECSSVLELDHNHTGALMLRAQTLVTLKEYHSALFDVNRLMELNSSSEVYKNLQTRLRTQLICFVQGKSLAPIAEDDEAEFEEEDCINGTELEEIDDGRQDSKEADECGHEEKAKIVDSTKANSKSSESEHICPKAVELVSPDQNIQKPSEKQPISWPTIPKPKGHSNLDYSRWDKVEDDSSEDDDTDSDDDDDSQPQYRFRVKTVGVRAVK